MLGLPKDQHGYKINSNDATSSTTRQTKFGAQKNRFSQIFILLFSASTESLEHAQPLLCRNERAICN